jgi:CBS-domain-containing membrane protein
MAGVLERIRWPQKRSVTRHSSSAPRVDLRVLELQAAKEILAEVFRIRVSDVEEMLQNRYDKICYARQAYEETEQWPREFKLNEWDE